MKLVSIFKLGERQMTSVGFGGCDLGADGATIVANYIRVSGSLTTLNLASNDIRAKGGKVIANALQVNCSLTSLNLSSNSLTGETGYTSRLYRGAGLLFRCWGPGDLPGVRDDHLKGQGQRR